MAFEIVERSDQTAGSVVERVLVKYTPEKGETVARVPEGVTVIGKEAFQYCSNLEEVILPAGLKVIGPWALADNKIECLVIPDSVERIGNHAFDGCHELEAVTLPRGLKALENGIFENCRKLRSVVLPQTLERIGENTFQNTALTAIELPEGLREIGSFAFYGCSQLVSIALPEGLREIGSSAFSRCEQLESIALSEGLREIGGFAFSECRQLESIALPEGLREIGSSAFSECRQLESIALPEGLRELPSNAFKGCSALVRVELPEGLVSIGESAFQSCTALEAVTLPSSLQSIGPAAFFACGKLKEVTLPVGLSCLSEDAFAGCPGLKLLTAPDADPEILRAIEACREASDRVVLACPTCGAVCLEPLTLSDHEAWAKAKAYAPGVVKWGETLAEPGIVATVEVKHPFCCRKGDCFSVTCKDEDEYGFIEARLLEIESVAVSAAVVRVEVLSVTNWRDLVSRVPTEVREDLKYTGQYCYSMPRSDMPSPMTKEYVNGLFQLENVFAEDIFFHDFMYTDEDGVDHLVMQYYSDFDRSWFLYGDKVLGLSGNRPFQWQNGLLIHATMKMVMACANDATDVIVPYGIETLGWNAFICKPNLISLTLPGTVRYYKCAFGECPKLKTVILTGGVSPESPLAKEIKWYFPDATIQYQ